MKKLFSGVLAAAVVLSVGASTVFAAGPGRGRCFTDVDGDGICDNAGIRCTYTDADGDGVCDNFVFGQGQGCGYGRGAQGGCGNGFRCGRGR